MLLDILVVEPPGRLGELGRRGRGVLLLLDPDAGDGGVSGRALPLAPLGGPLGLRLRRGDGLDDVRRRRGVEAGLAVGPTRDPGDQRLRGRAAGRGLGRGGRGLREGDVEVRGGGGRGGAEEEEGRDAAAAAEDAGRAAEEWVDGDDNVEVEWSLKVNINAKTINNPVVYRNHCWDGDL